MLKKIGFIILGLIVLLLIIGFFLKPSPIDLDDYLGEKIAESDYVKVGNVDKYLNRPNATMPEEHNEILSNKTEIPIASILKRNDINQLLKPGYLSTENGFCRLEDGTMYVSALTKMPGVTLEMIDWWFWWHAAEAQRYQIWYPDMHYDISSYFRGSYTDTTLSYSERLHQSAHLVNEDIGSGAEDILIDFISPEDFGFDPRQLDPEKETIICARVGSPEMGSWGSEMVHFVRATADGVEMRSRFWIGNKIYEINKSEEINLHPILNKPFVKKRLIADEVGINMFHHCAQEFHNLAEVLPELYEKMGSSNSI